MEQLCSYMVWLSVIRSGIDQYTIGHDDQESSSILLHRIRCMDYYFGWCVPVSDLDEGGDSSAHRAQDSP